MVYQIMPNLVLIVLIGAFGAFGATFAPYNKNTYYTHLFNIMSNQHEREGIVVLDKQHILSVDSLCIPEEYKV